MTDMTGCEVLDRLKSDPITKDIPVIINTSKAIDDEELRHLTAGDSRDPIEGRGKRRQDALANVHDALSKAGFALAASASEP